MARTTKQPKIEEHKRSPSKGDDRFPEKLLTAPHETRLRYFWDKILHHPLLDEAHHKLERHICSFPEGGTVNVYGPTGVGKTTLANLIHKLFREKHPLTGQFTDCDPLVSLPAVSSQLERFSWKTFLNRLLLHLDYQYPQNNINFSIPGINRNAAGQLMIDRRVPATDLREAVEQLIRAVKPRAILVDEAPHMNKLQNGSRTIDQMDVLKSLTDATQTVIVLIGTYALYDMANLNGQQGRRSYDLHFTRYQYDDIHRFRKFLRSMQVHIPLPDTPYLDGMDEYMYEKSLGCAGVAKTWVYTTYQSVLEGNRKQITRKDLERNEFTKGKIFEMAKDIKDGEQKIQSKEQECDTYLRAFLGMSKK